MYLRLQCLGPLEISRMQRLSQLHQLSDRIFLDQFAVVQVVVKHVEAPVDVYDMCFESGRGAFFDTLEFRGEDGVDGLGGGRDMGAVAFAQS
jgi:hypothetical protein